MVTILVTAGPTREYLDDVRYLTNASSGRMGYALAVAGTSLGHRVTLVSGPTELEPPVDVELQAVVSGLEMQAEAERAFPRCQVAFGAAAVADYRPGRRQPGKPAKTGGPFSLALRPNPDIIAGLGGRKGDRVVVGFALESADGGLEAAVERGAPKLRSKHLDLLVVNLDTAVGRDHSQVVLLFADGRREDLPEQSKEATAEHLVRLGVDLWKGRTEARG